MSALPRIAKAPDGHGASAPSARVTSTAPRAALEIPPPIPTAPATREQVLASLELGIAQARDGLVEDSEVVQARMRAKYGLRSR